VKKSSLCLNHWNILSKALYDDEEMQQLYAFIDLPIRKDLQRKTRHSILGHYPKKDGHNGYKYYLFLILLSKLGIL